MASRMKNWWSPVSPDKLGNMPWMHPAVVDYLEHILKPEWSVLEHGSGSGTVWLRERVRRIVSVENNPAWFEVVSAGVRAEDLYILECEERIPAEVFEEKYDLVLIDGQPTTMRVQYLQMAARLVRPGGWVVLDNCNRPEYAIERKRMQALADYSIFFNVNPPKHQHAVTEFYKVEF